MRNGDIFDSRDVDLKGRPVLVYPDLVAAHHQGTATQWCDLHLLRECVFDLEP